MNYTEIVKEYLEYGYQCLPTNEKKEPYLQGMATWKEEIQPNYFENCHGVGLKMGEPSGWIECMDFDNHMNNAKSKLSEYLSIPEVKELYVKYKFPIESTVSGGFHILYRCREMEGSRKLAQQRKEDGSIDTFIETKGLASYICFYPTPGYVAIRNDIYNIPTISQFERAVLIDNAISMNEVMPKIEKTEYESTDRPGDLYNANRDSINEMKSILSSAGWQDLGSNRWRRPGKKEGISATLGKVAPNILYVFTSNAYPFDQNHGYSPFQVLGLVKFNGDFKEAAKSIAPEREERQVKGTLQVSELDKILNGAYIDTRRIIEKPPTILSLVEACGSQYVHRRILTLGNFSCIIGKAKSKKTFFISLITSALLNNESNEWLVGSMPEHKNEILYFDTEQGEYDAYNVIRRIEKLAGTGRRLRAYNLRPFSPIERCQIIEYAFKIFGDRIGYCVIDGIADLANGINDEDEATRVVTILLRLSKVYNCHISTVIHQNKNDEFATGHLGSSVMKKAEILISVTKSENNSSIIKCDMSRGEGFENITMSINFEGLPEIMRESNIPISKPKYYERSVDEMEF